MFIDLSRIPPEGLDLALPEAELDVGASDGTWEGPARVSADLHVARSGHDFLITGTFTGRLNLLCGRCLERFQFRAEDAFNLFCPVAATAPAAEEHELAEDDLDVTYVEEGKLNTDQLLRESLLLSLPVQPLCRDDCRGLCPRCGADQNQGPCDCAPVGTDPRLQVLKKLL